MIGFFIGVFCGAVELLMLTKLVAGFANKGAVYTAAVFFVKIGVLAAGLALTAILFRNDLLWFAIGATGVLIIGSIAIFCARAFTKENNDG